MQTAPESHLQPYESVGEAWRLPWFPHGFFSGRAAEDCRRPLGKSIEDRQFLWYYEKNANAKEVHPMLQIAICDDQPNELAALTALTEEFTAAHCPEAIITPFSHPDALAAACEHQSFHIYLLDMVMPMLSGLDVGRSIRRISTDAQIIYVTTEPGYALDAYAVNPLHYLLKPVQRQELFAALELAVKKTDFGGESLLTLKTQTGLRTISVDRIACCECRSHTAVYTLTGGESVETTTLRGSFAQHIAPLLADRRFLSPHSSFAVNMSQVERLSREGFSLRGGAFVPVSGKQYPAVRSAYLNYRLGEGTQ